MRLARTALVAAAVSGILGSASASTLRAGGSSASVVAKHDCKGKNDCKGLGGCKVDGKHACKGQNACKGQGGCRS